MGTSIWLPNGDTVPLLRREQLALAADDPAWPVSRAEIEVGLFETGHKFQFRCPLCDKIETNDQRMEIMCTGPHPSLDEHPPELMVFTGHRSA